MVPDVGELLDELKSNVLSGLVILLSGLVPLGVRVEDSEIGMQAQSFGAQVLDSVSKRVTHLVVSTERPRTKKVQQAAKISSIRIVNQNWLADCLSQWRRLDERPYYVDILDSDRTKSGDTTEPVSEDEDGDSNDNANDLVDFDWDTADKEMQDLLGSDDDSESDAPESETESNGTEGSQKRGRKRKAETDEDEDDGEEDESALAKKQRVARSRGHSTLRAGIAADGEGKDSALPTPGPTGDEEDEGMTNVDNGADFDEDELERDLLAELEAAED